ncbi:MAG: hypothetical protein KVP17_003211 [Porospora cf. gigantea B]|uniref:uncharacterized protein n=1 Tax=Porospora cf. gigantea B TaxID=2853592 RepID=UPI0035717D80|nr:MAG: hypothetical protein KVP17_003211 [Porospora cf. gigantea B]
MERLQVLMMAVCRFYVEFFFGFVVGVDNEILDDIRAEKGAEMVASLQCFQRPGVLQKCLLVLQSTHHHTKAQLGLKIKTSYLSLLRWILTVSGIRHFRQGRRGCHPEQWRLDDAVEERISSSDLGLDIFPSLATFGLPRIAPAAAVLENGDFEFVPVGDARCLAVHNVFAFIATCIGRRAAPSLFEECSVRLIDEGSFFAEHILPLFDPLTPPGNLFLNTLSRKGRRSLTRARVSI